MLERPVDIFAGDKITYHLNNKSEEASITTKQWYKGQLHAHANWGLTALGIPTTAPDTVVRWYREHDYNFVAVTDLNYFTPVAGLASVFDAPGRFIVLQGIELNHEFPTVGDTIVDTLGIDIEHSITPPTGNVPSQLLQAQAEAITAAGGLAIAAHPNLSYAWGAADILATDPSSGPKLFELWNAEPGMNPMGGGGRPSTEAIWDAVLSAGRTLYGVATDDSHHFHCRDFGLRYANPGRAWVMVHAAELTPAALVKALEKGHFYASTGVELEAYKVNQQRIRIELSDRTTDIGWSNPGTNPQLYVTQFIGQNGAVLAVDETLTPTYHFTGTELYVRAKIVNSDGHIAWTQPVFPASP
jgi:hypothetical protein